MPATLANLIGLALAAAAPAAPLQSGDAAAPAADQSGGGAAELPPSLVPS